MKNLISRVSVILFLAVSVSAQIEEKQPRLVDEFGRLNAEENFARLDFLAFELSKNEGLTSVIRIHGGGENCFLCHYWQGSYTTAIIKSRLSYIRNSVKENQFFDRYSIEYCNGSDDLRVQLYLMPPESTLPGCNQTLEIPKNSVLFQTIYFFSNNQIKPLENTFVASTSEADGEYSLKSLKEVKNILDEEAESKIYIIAYLGTNLEHEYYDKKKGFVKKEIRKLDRKSLAKRLIQNAKNEFFKNGIKSSQIETIEGGYVDNKRRLEFWFVPKGGEIPKPKPDYFPKKGNKI